MFSELMSDYISNSEQNVEMTAATEQPGSSQASTDSTNPEHGAENTTQNKAGPPLKVTDYSLEGWPNSNNKPVCEVSTAEEAASQDSVIATPVGAPRTPSIHRDPSGCLALTNSADRNPFLSAYTQSGVTSKAPNKPNENLSTQIEDNPLRYVFRTPPSRNLSSDPGNTEQSTYTPNSKASAKTAPDSTVTRIRRESQAAREDFRSSLGQLSQVHSRLAREKREHAMRADVIMRDMDEIERASWKYKQKDTQNQGRLEVSMPPVNDLIK